MQFILVLLHLAGFIYAVNGLSCYVCSSDNKAVCNDPFNATAVGSTEKVTNTSFVACTKSKVEVNGVSQVMRNGTAYAQDCGAGPNECLSASIFGFGGSMCCCTTDFCNSAPSLRNLSAFLMIILVVVAFVNERF